MVLADLVHESLKPRHGTQLLLPLVGDGDHRDGAMLLPELLEHAVHDGARHAGKRHHVDDPAQPLVVGLDRLAQRDGGLPLERVVDVPVAEGQYVPGPRLPEWAEDPPEIAGHPRLVENLHRVHQIRLEEMVVVSKLPVLPHAGEVDVVDPLGEA